MFENHCLILTQAKAILQETEHRVFTMLNDNMYGFSVHPHTAE